MTATVDGRRPMVGTSWKMNLLPSTAPAWFRTVATGTWRVDDREVFVLPPVPMLPAARDCLAGTAIRWGGQDVHPEDAGAHTGDVSAPMLADLGCTIAEIGHSERRRDHHETDALLARKVRAALRWGLSPLLCVGERSPGPAVVALRVVARQLVGALGSLGPDELARVIVAYEPVWAIGEGAQAAPVAHVEAVHRFIRRWLDRRGGESVPVLYGGSVDRANAPALLAADAVDGLFVGRAALAPDTFVTLATLPLPRKESWAMNSKRSAERLAIGADDAGIALKEALVAHVRELGLQIDDIGVASPEAAAADGTDYPDVAERLARGIAAGIWTRGILVCGTGIGMAIAANKVPGVRAAQAHDVYSAERARKSNDAQIVTLGARVIGVELAKSIVTAFLRSEFAGGASTRKVEKLKALDAALTVGVGAPATGGAPSDAT